MRVCVSQRYLHAMVCTLLTCSACNVLVLLQRNTKPHSACSESLVEKIRVIALM